MTYISFFDGITISLTSIIVVFFLLFLLSVIINTFQYVFKEKKAQIPQTEFNPATELNTLNPIEEDDETKTVAILTALILLNEESGGKTYEILSAKRVK